MKKTALRLTVISLTRITRDLPRLLLGMLASAAILFTSAAANPALAAGVASASQGQASYIDEEEEKAYRAATKEPDEKKRAAKLYEFIQKYPKSALMQQSDYNAIKLIEEEYSAYYAASQETDFERRAAMLLAFIQKYPESTLKEYVGLEYKKMLQESAQRKNFEQLESLSETWLKTHPNDKDVYSFIAEAAANLKKYQKCAEYLEAIYAMEPGPGLAKEIHAK